jgi:hypothetical protein
MSAVARGVAHIIRLAHIQRGGPRRGRAISGARNDPMTTATIPRPLSFAGAPLSAWEFGVRIWVAVVAALARFWRHAGRRPEQMPQGPTFVPKGADLSQTAAMRSGSVKSALLGGPVFDRGLEGSASARRKCLTASFAFFLRHPRPARPGPVLFEASEQPKGGQPIQGIEAMADVTSSDRLCVATMQLPLADATTSRARDTIP